jgi:hypothetical protein
MAMAIAERHSTLQGVGGQLDKGIDMEQLLANAFVKESPALGSTLRPPIDTPRPPTDIVKEVQCASKMLEFVATNATKVVPEEDDPALQDQDLGINDDEDELALQEVDLGVREDVVMDGLDALQNACILFYIGARCNKLVRTLMLMNMCPIHGCFNKFVDELFSILHKFLLPMDNCLFSNMHGAKTLTQ